MAFNLNSDDDPPEDYEPGDEVDHDINPEEEFALWQWAHEDS